MPPIPGGFSEGTSTDISRRRLTLRATAQAAAPGEHPKQTSGHRLTCLGKSDEPFPRSKSELGQQGAAGPAHTAALGERPWAQKTRRGLPLTVIVEHMSPSEGPRALGMAWDALYQRVP